VHQAVKVNITLGTNFEDPLQKGGISRVEDGKTLAKKGIDKLKLNIYFIYCAKNTSYSQEKSGRLFHFDDTYFSVLSVIENSPTLLLLYFCYISFQMTPDENSEISSIVTIGSGINDDNHQDEDGRNELQHKLRIVNEFITVIHMQTCEYLQFLVLLRSIVPTIKRRRRRKRIRRPNIHHDRSSVLSFVHSWNDEMFKRQFCII